MDGGAWIEVVERASCSIDTLFLLGASFRYGWLIIKKCVCFGLVGCCVGHV